MRPSARSSGVATEDAMVSGEAPGSDALIEITGKSTCGSGDTGSRRKPIAPLMAMASVSSGGHRPVNEQGEEFHGSSCVSGWRCVLRASLSNSR